MPIVMGDWVIFNTNVSPSNASMGVIAISQANASKITRIEPMPLKPGEVSWTPVDLSVDMQNNRIYVTDPGPAKAVGINFNQKTGNMTLAWSADQKTEQYLLLLGPANHRVVLGTNILSNVTNPLDLVPGPKGNNYKQQVLWRDAATGKLLAASDYFGPAGAGGLVYDAQIAGQLMALKVLPTSSSSPSTSPSSPTSANSTSTGSTGG